MRVYGLTELGKKVIRNKWEDTEDFRILDYVRNNRSATESELDVIGSRYAIRNLKERGLIRELTT